ncbi:MAG: proline--tRNA ligase [Gammaproteobacteria bacterium]|nr:proline--tRNA ligase [Gammaproteobacteria bacterium]
MKSSNFTIATLKENPADADIASHQLLIRGGFIRKLATGLYNWLPMGQRVLNKVTRIVREEMDNSGAQEVLMPVVQPADLWRESGRWDKYDAGDLLKFTDRHDREFCFGPTHEEIITDIARNELKSHKQLPVNFYQIQTKFRDEIRPRFGLLRAREFLMKDAYSFHIEESCLQRTYDLMHDTYCRILDRLGLDYRPVLADTGAIGGNASMEFQVLAESGEDVIAFSTESDYAANIELAESLPPVKASFELLTMEEVATPDRKTIVDVAAFLQVEPTRTVKTLIVEGDDDDLVALILRGDHQLNPLKAEKITGVKSPLVMASDKAIKKATGANPGSLGPVNLPMRVIADRDAAALVNFICGANRDDYHFTNVNWDRDVPVFDTCDLRNVVEGDPSPDGKGQLKFRRGIEVGHIFQLHDVYSSKMNATVLNEEGKAVTMIMGCYGLGVTRLIAAIVEQHHDDKGIIWPLAIAPFQVTVIPINAHKSPQVQEVSEAIYTGLRAAGVEVLLDDREGVRPGAKFADAELMGIPHRLVVGDRGLENNHVEWVVRQSGKSVDLPLEEVVTRITQESA